MLENLGVHFTCARLTRPAHRGLQHCGFAIAVHGIWEFLHANYTLDYPWAARAQLFQPPGLLSIL